jgi:hypothetical protein
MMSSVSTSLAAMLSRLDRAARRKGLSDAEWARRSGVAKETLCRLRSRQTCDLATLEALARSVGARVAVVEKSPDSSPHQSIGDGFWPERVDRDYEARLVDLAASGSTSPDAWRPLGPSFFLAGFATMLASLPGLDRQRWLALAEALHPGATEPRVFERWLAGTPSPPSRILPMVVERLRRAA